MFARSSSLAKLRISTCESRTIVAQTHATL